MAQINLVFTVTVYSVECR